MGERRAHRDFPPDQPLTPDMIEQHQRPDGTVEDLENVEARPDRPLSPDMIEQRQRADGSLDDYADDAGETPLTPDVIEQRHAIEEDDGSDDWRD